MRGKKVQSRSRIGTVRSAIAVKTILRTKSLSVNLYPPNRASRLIINRTTLQSEQEFEWSRIVSPSFFIVCNQLPV